MSEKLTEHQAYAFARSAVAQDPRLMDALLHGMMAGHADHIASVNERLTWTREALVAAISLANGRHTPALKKHLEFCLMKFLEPTARYDCKGVRDFVAAHEAQP